MSRASRMLGLRVSQLPAAPQNWPTRWTFHFNPYGSEGSRGNAALDAAAIIAEENRLKEEREMQIRSREEFLLEIRERPEVCEKLFIQDHHFDDDVLRLCAQVDDLSLFLRDAGLSAAEAIRIANLFPDALLAPRPKEPKPPCSRRFVFVVACLLIIIVLIIVWITAQATPGWHRGICNIAEFGNNGSCSGQLCKLNLLVRQAGKAREYWVNDWDPPLDPISYRQDRVKLRGEPFRCCDESQAFSCCSFIDLRSMYMCDHWEWKDDEQGAPCPAGNWDCMFKAEMGDDSEINKVTEVKVHEAFLHWPYILGILIIAVCIPCSFSGIIWRKVLELIDERKEKRKAARLRAQTEADRRSGSVFEQDLSAAKEEKQQHRLSRGRTSILSTGSVAGARLSLKRSRTSLDLEETAKNDLIDSLHRPYHRGSAAQCVDVERPEPRSDATDMWTNAKQYQSEVSERSEGLQQGNVFTKLCPAGHQLIEERPIEEGWYCSECMTEIPRGAALHGCRECNYDICVRCLLSKAKPRQGSKAKSTQEERREPQPAPRRVSIASEPVAVVRWKSEGGESRPAMYESETDSSPPKPSPLPEKPEPPSTQLKHVPLDAQEWHPSFQHGDLASLAQTYQPDLLQPIIAPMPHSRGRNSRNRALRNPGCRKGGVSPASGSPRSPASSRQSSRATSQGTKHSGVRTNLDVSNSAAGQQNLRVAGFGLDAPGFPGHDGVHRGQVGVPLQDSPSKDASLLLPPSGNGRKKAAHSGKSPAHRGREGRNSTLAAAAVRGLLKP